MKRINRNPEKFEVMDLFSVLGRKEGFALSDDTSAQRFVQKVEAVFNQYKGDSKMIYGRRVESMFGYIAASLGKCTAIKHEDDGELYVSDINVQIPDYRIVLEDGYEFLVEVKNFHRSEPFAKFTLTASTVRKLRNYAVLFKKDLKIAIYWSGWSKWTLICPDKVLTSKGGISVDLPRALEIDEMAMLGDLMVATTPPLTFRIVTDSNKPRFIDSNGRVQFTIGGIQFYCGNTLIEDEFEKSLAFSLMMFGKWPTTEPMAHIDDGELLWIDISSAPEETTAEQDFEIVGLLSQIISHRYDTLTTSEHGVERLSPAQEPGSLGVLIPPDYKGQYLPLWRFKIQPSQ